MIGASKYWTTTTLLILAAATATLFGKNDARVPDELRLVDESADEVHDAEIYRYVYESVRKWEEGKRSRGGKRAKREVSRVCYEDIGCFEDTGPFSYLEMLPSPPKDVGTRFFVYGSRKARSIPMEVPAEAISDKANNAIDPELPTKVIVHGFGSSCDHVWVYEMRSALMAVIECNIVCVDWGPGSAVPNYVRAAANTRLVGRQLAKLVRSLNVPLDKIHLIGFSLGAHVAGFAGAELGNVSRITGLDPAGPLFESQDPRARLDASDARFVDVIHSNGEQLILGGLGSWQPMGDVDFYPNGGRMQSGCSNLFVGAVSDIIWSNPVEGRSLCNHRRAYKLFTDSISPKCRFPAFPCSGGFDGLLRGECFPCGSESSPAECGDMGFYSDKSSARGQLFLVTRDEEPFCAHQYQVKVYNGRHERPVKSYGKLQVTLISEGSINETFTMTKKDDEELLVGATLQKIVVPHPALSSLDAIEVKYTAYSGWISSGLVSWAVDKVQVIDSYGTVFSVCKRGLVLESGKPLYLPLYRDQDCNNNNVGSSNPDSESVPVVPLVVDEVKDKPIGPFTRDHNYPDRGQKDGFSKEVPVKGPMALGPLGPFTKEENLKIASANSQNAKLTVSKDHGESKNKNYQSVSNLWTIAELTSDGGSNSVENNNIGEFAERGRGFSSGSNTLTLNLDRGNVLPLITVSPEIMSSSSEPVVLRGSKKESGRSLKLSEMLEPVLRGARQDAPKPEMEDRKHELMEESQSSNQGFTVQFLPERLAGILAQAERYARMTLLPLISQYTPSFIGGGGARSDRPKYFPPLGNLFGNRDEDDKSKVPNDSRTRYYYEFEEVTVSTTTPGKAETTSTKSNNEWVPISVQAALPTTDNRKEKSYEGGGWQSEGGSNWSPPRGNDSDSQVQETKIDDWVPLVSSSEKTLVKNDSEDTLASQDKKFIPLVEFEGEPVREVKRARSIVFPYVYERKNDPRTRYIPLLPEEDLGRRVKQEERRR